MGVPSFFSWVYKIIKNISVENFNTPIDCFHLDANSLFHPKCQEVLSKYQNSLISEDELEDIMIKEIIISISGLIKKVKTTKVFISVDGVVPLGKIKQQRLRRFKRVFDEEKMLKYSDSVGHKIRTWNNTKITPGTLFMDKLHTQLLKYVSLHKNIEYSSFKENGEGEHKIFSKIKKAPGKHMIYGMDTDLLFLSFISAKHFGSDIWLLREKEANEFEIISIKTCMSIIDEHIKTKYNTKFDLTIPQNISIIDDFIFIMFFIGNDFIPSSPSIDAKFGGVNILLNQYIFIVKNTKKSIVTINKSTKKYTININFLTMFIYGISSRKVGEDNMSFEEYYFKKKLPENIERFKKSKIEKSKILEEEILNAKKNISKLKYEKLAFDDSNMINDKFVDLGIISEERNIYTFNYYKTFFNSNGNIDDVTSICKLYFKSMMWTAQYYYFECPSWTWYYPYNKSPFLSDFYVYLKNGNNVNCVFESVTQPISINTQLVLVTPSKYSYIMQPFLRPLISSNKSILVDMYPVSSGSETSLEYMEWKCLPKLPRFDYNRVNKEVLKLTK